MEQLHKKFTDHQVKELICRYLAGEIKVKDAAEVRLGQGKNRSKESYRQLRQTSENGCQFHQGCPVPCPCSVR